MNVIRCLILLMKSFAAHMRYWMKIWLFRIGTIFEKERNFSHIKKLTMGGTVSVRYGTFFIM